MRDWLTKDFSWKIFSVALAVIIWLTVHKIYEEPGASAGSGGGDKVTYDNLPVLLVSATADVSNYRLVQPTVTVTISGSPDAIAVLQANQIRATVDLSGIQTNRDLKWRVDVSVPPRVTLVSVAPPKIGIIIPPKR
jgi:YbbR domain-containing protein